MLSMSHIASSQYLFQHASTKSHDRIRVVCRGGKMKCHCIRWSQTKCQERIKKRTSVTVIWNNQMGNVTESKECQQYFPVFNVYISREKTLLKGNCAFPILCTLNRIFPYLDMENCRKQCG